ncbi:MAG: hypothetical protein DMG61_07690, partial [Acidobacteria bacterium]
MRQCGDATDCAQYFPQPRVQCANRIGRQSRTNLAPAAHRKRSACVCGSAARLAICAVGNGCACK